MLRISSMYLAVCRPNSREWFCDKGGAFILKTLGLSIAFVLSDLIKVAPFIKLSNTLS